MAMLPQLQAEQQLAAITAASVPYMKPETSGEILRKLERHLGGDGKAKPASTADIAALGITVETVGADGLPVDAGTRRDGTEDA
jgi:hypothetical protein